MQIEKQVIGCLGFVLVVCWCLGCHQQDPVDEDSDSTVHPDWVWQCENSGDNSDAEDGDYYPTADGAQWSFRRFGGLELIDNDILILDLDSWENLTMTEVTYDGQPAFMIEDTATTSGKVTQNTHMKVGDVVFRKHKEKYEQVDPDTPVLSIDYFLGDVTSGVSGIDDYVGGFTRFDFDWADQEEGWSETLAYNRLVDIDDSGNNGTIGEEDVRVHEFTVESVDETVTVPAGTFTNCIKIQRARQREPDDNSSTAEQNSDIKNFWFCPGIGKVKEQEVNDDPRTEELLYYCIPDGLCC